MVTKELDRLFEVQQETTWVDQTGDQVVRGVHPLNQDKVIDPREIPSKDYLQDSNYARVQID